MSRSPPETTLEQKLWPQVLHVSDSDGDGGAAKAAYRIHKELKLLDVDSRMLVRQRTNPDGAVYDVQPLSRAVKLARRFWAEVAAYSYSPAPNQEIFSTAKGIPWGDKTELLEDADIINLHWVAGFLDYRAFFSSLAIMKPLVWTLHDMNPFTGGCHYTGDCNKFTQICGACPQLGSTQNRDLSTRTFCTKENCYSRLPVDRTVFVAPSLWIQAKARESTLLRKFRIEHIRNGIDLRIFRPRNRREIRAILEISESDRVILFVTYSINNYRKGIDLLRDAIFDLPSRDHLLLISVGKGSSNNLFGCRHVHIGVVESELLLSLFYNAADVFVAPYREDNLPQTALEAMACGCPVVGFSTGGLPDIVCSGNTGFLSRPFIIQELREGIEIVLNEPGRRDSLGKKARDRAEKFFSLTMQANAYKNLYTELIADRSKPS